MISIKDIFGKYIRRKPKKRVRKDLPPIDDFIPYKKALRREPESTGKPLDMVRDAIFEGYKSKRNNGVKVKKSVPTESAPAESAPAQPAGSRFTGEIDRIRNEYANSVARQKQATSEAEKAKEAAIQAQYDAVLKKLQAQAKALPGRIRDIDSRGQRQLDLLEQQAALAKDTAEEDTGADIRELAENKRALDARRRNMFATLGTIDSMGEMGYTGQQMRADMDFSRNQAQLLRDKEAALRNIDLQLLSEKARAEAEVEDAIATFKDMLDEINSQLEYTPAEKKRALAEVYSEFQNDIADIDARYNQTLLDLERQRTEIENERDRLAKDEADASKVELDDDDRITAAALKAANDLNDLILKKDEYYREGRGKEYEDKLKYLVSTYNSQAFSLAGQNIPAEESKLISGLMIPVRHPADFGSSLLGKTLGFSPKNDMTIATDEDTILRKIEMAKKYLPMKAKNPEEVLRVAGVGTGAGVDTQGDGDVVTVVVEE